MNVTPGGKLYCLLYDDGAGEYAAASMTAKDGFNFAPSSVTITREDFYSTMCEMWPYFEYHTPGEMYYSVDRQMAAEREQRAISERCKRILRQPVEFSADDEAELDETYAGFLAGTR
jgi:hypothetical protein